MAELVEERTAERSPQSAVEAVIASLSSHFGDRLATGRAIREQHANTVTWLANEAPDAVVFAESTEDVQKVVRACAKYAVPVIAFGTGSSLEGQVNAPLGGISIDLSRMNRVLSVHMEDLDCTVEPGVTRKQLNEHLRDLGLFFPIDPGADASLGGMASTRASGTNAVRYGTMRDNVIALTAVLANGEIVTTARRAKKSSAGYDLTRLFIGAEGTLGIITALTLRLHGIPEAISAGICGFPTIRTACDAVIATIQSGIPVARIELLDEVQVRACNAYSKLTLAEQPTLFVEFHGTEAGVAEQAERFGEIAAEYGGGDVRLGDAAGGAHQTVAGAARCLLGGAAAAARLEGAGHRCLRAAVAPCRMRRRDQARHRGDGADRADRRPCRRRQFPHHAADHDG